MNAITFKRLFRRSDVSLSHCARPICKKTQILRRLCATGAGVLALVGVLGFTSPRMPVLTFAKYSYIEAKGNALCHGSAFVGSAGDKNMDTDSQSLLVPLDSTMPSYESQIQLFAGVNSQVTSGNCSTNVEGNSAGFGKCYVTPTTKSGHGLIEVNFEAFSPCIPNVGCQESNTDMSFGSQGSPNMMQMNVPFTLPANSNVINYKVNINYFHMAHMQITMDMAPYLRQFSWRIVNARGKVVASIPENQINGTWPQAVTVSLRPGTYRLETSMSWMFHVQFVGGNSFMHMYGGWGDPFAGGKFEFIPIFTNDTSSGGTDGGMGGGL